MLRRHADGDREREHIVNYWSKSGFVCSLPSAGTCRLNLSNAMSNEHIDGYSSCCIPSQILPVYARVIHAHPNPPPKRRTQTALPTPEDEHPRHSHTYEAYRIGYDGMGSFLDPTLHACFVRSFASAHPSLLQPTSRKGHHCISTVRCIVILYSYIVVLLSIPPSVFGFARATMAQRVRVPPRHSRSPQEQPPPNRVHDSLNDSSPSTHTSRPASYHSVTRLLVGLGLIEYPRYDALLPHHRRLPAFTVPAPGTSASRTR